MLKELQKLQKLVQKLIPSLLAKDIIYSFYGGPRLAYPLYVTATTHRLNVLTLSLVVHFHNQSSYSVFIF